MKINRDKQLKYAIRKTTLGVGSLVIGMWILSGSPFLQDALTTIFPSVNLVVEAKAAETEYVQFKDAKLKTAILKQTEHENPNEITAEEAQKVTTLDLNCTLIGDLTGLENFTHLTELNLGVYLPLSDSNNTFYDPKRSKSFNYAINPDMSYGQIKDFSPLKRLTHLTTLDLVNRNITDISFLQDLTNLRHLRLGYNQISDLSPLQGLTKLEHLYLEHNEINDIQPIKNASSTLEELDLSHNQIKNISPLQDLSKLIVLILDYNQISDLSPLKDIR